MANDDSDILKLADTPTSATATLQKEKAKEDDSDILKLASDNPVYVQPKEPTQENPLIGYLSNTAKAIGDYATHEPQEIAKNPRAALNATAAGAVKGIGEFSTLPIGLLAAAAKHLNPEGLEQAIQTYPPLRRAVMLSRGQVTNPQYLKETQAYPYSEGTGAAVGPMAVPIGDLAKLGQVVAPILNRIANPVLRRAAQTYLGALPLSGAVATQQQANSPNGSLSSGVLQTLAGASLPAVASAAFHGRAGGNGKPNIPPNATPLEKELITMPHPTAELPALVKQTPVKVGEKYFDIKDPYERAAYEYYKKPTSKGGIRAKRWLDTNYPQRAHEFRNDGLAISKGLPLLGEVSQDATVQVAPGHAQEATRITAENELNEKIQKDRDKYEKEYEKAIKQKQQEQDKIHKEAEKQKKEQDKLQAQKDKEYGDAIDKAEKDKAAAEAKADKLHEQVLAAADKETKAQLRKEETAAWKEYAEYDKALDKANEEHTQYRASVQAEVKRQAEKSAKQQKQDEALNQIYPQKESQAPIRSADINWGDRQARLDGIRTYEKRIDLGKLSEYEKPVLQQFEKHQRTLNDAERELEITSEAEAKKLGIPVELVTKVIKPSFRTQAQEQSGVLLKKGTTSIQATPLESSKITQTDKTLDEVVSYYNKAKVEYDTFRNHPFQKSGLTPVEIMQKRLKEGEYTEYKGVNVYHGRAPLTPTKGTTPTTEASFKTNEDLMAEATLNDRIELKKPAEAKALEIRKATRSMLSTMKGPSETIKHLQEVNKALEALNPPKLGGTSAKQMKSGQLNMTVPGLNELIDVASIIKAKLPKTSRDLGILEEQAQALAGTIKNRNIYKRNDPELMQKIDDIRAQGHRFQMGVKAPLTDAQNQAFNEALKPSSNEGEIYGGEGIYGKLDQSTRNYALRLRVFREDIKEAVQDSMEKHFGNSEGEIEDVNANFVNWQSNPRVRLFRALQVDKENYGSGGDQSVGTSVKKATRNLQTIYTSSNPAIHWEHLEGTVIDNLAAHPIDTMRLLDRIATIPEFREVLAAFDFGGAMRTNYVEQLTAEGNPLPNSDSWFKIIGDTIGDENLQHFKNGLQGNFVEKNFKLYATRGVGFTEAANQLKISVKDLSQLLLKDMRGEQLTLEEETNVLFAHATAAQYVEDTIGGSVPGLRDSNFIEHFPATHALTSFVTTRTMQGQFMNKSAAAAADSIAAGEYGKGADYIRRAVMLQALQVLVNGSKGVGVGVGIGAALGLKGDERKNLDQLLNKSALIGNAVNNFTLPLQPQNFPIYETLLRGGSVLSGAVQSFDKLRYAAFGKQKADSSNADLEEERRSQILKTNARSAATLLALFGATKWLDGAIGTQVVLSIAFHAYDVMHGSKQETHFGDFGTFIGKEPNVPTDAGKEFLEFMTKGTDQHFLDLQSQLEDEDRARLKLQWLNNLSSLPGIGSAFQGYHDVYQNGLKKEAQADKKNIALMKVRHLPNNTPAHNIDSKYKAKTAFSWREQLDDYEAPQPTALGKAIKALNETSEDTNP